MRRRCCCRHHHPLARRVLHVFFPARNQAATLGAGAVFGVVVVDELHLGRVGHARVLGHLRVAGQLELLGRQAKLLAAGRECPFVELLGGLGVGAVLDDAHGAHLGARAFRRRDRAHREAIDRLSGHVVHEAHRHRGLAPGGRLDGRRARAGVGADVGVQGLEVFKRLFLAHDLHQRSDHGVGRATRCRVGHLHLALELGLEQVGPRLRRVELALGQQLLVVAKAQRAQVHAHGAVFGVHRLLLRPGVQLREQVRFVFERQALLGRLQVRVARAAKPDVGLGVGLLGVELGQRFARAFGGHVDLGARGLGIHGGHQVAPLGLHRADDVDLALGVSAGGQQGQGGSGKGVGDGLAHRGLPFQSNMTMKFQFILGPGHASGHRDNTQGAHARRHKRKQTQGRTQRAPARWSRPRGNS